MTVLLRCAVVLVAAAALSGCSGDSPIDTPDLPSVPTGLPTTLPSGIPTSIPTNLPSLPPIPTPGG